MVTSHSTNHMEECPYLLPFYDKCNFHSDSQLCSAWWVGFGLQSRVIVRAFKPSSEVRDCTVARLIKWQMIVDTFKVGYIEGGYYIGTCTIGGSLVVNFQYSPTTGAASMTYWFQNQLLLGDQSVVFFAESGLFCSGGFSSVSATGLATGQKIGLTYETDPIGTSGHFVKVVVCASSDTSCTTTGSFGGIVSNIFLPTQFIIGVGASSSNGATSGGTDNPNSLAADLNFSVMFLLFTAFLSFLC